MSMDLCFKIFDKDRSGSLRLLCKYYLKILEHLQSMLLSFLISVAIYSEMKMVSLISRFLDIILYVFTFVFRMDAALTNELFMIFNVSGDGSMSREEFRFCYTNWISKVCKKLKNSLDIHLLLDSKT